MIYVYIISNKLSKPNSTKAIHCGNNTGFECIYKQGRVGAPSAQFSLVIQLTQTARAHDTDLDSLVNAFEQTRRKASKALVRINESVDGLSYGVVGDSLDDVRLSATCPSGHALADLICIPCRRGARSSTDMQGCFLCERGSFADRVGAGACQRCARERPTTVREGATTAEECISLELAFAMHHAWALGAGGAFALGALGGYVYVRSVGGCSILLFAECTG